MKDRQSTNVRRRGCAVEGSEDSWEMFQDVPLPVVLFCVMYTKAKVLYTKLVERR